MKSKTTKNPPPVSRASHAPDGAPFRKAARSGQSIAEVLVAVVVGVILIGAAASLILPALKSNSQVTNVQAGSTLAKGMLDDVRVFSEGNWNNLLALATGSANIYFLQTQKSPFVAATGTESIPYDNITSGLVGRWNFEEGTGTTSADSSGNGNTATISGGWVPGKVGQWAVSQAFGSSNSITYSIASSNQPVLGVSVTAWVNVANHSNYISYLSNAWCSSPGSWSLFSDSSGNVNFGVAGSGGCSSETNATGGSGSFTTRTWHFLTGTYDGVAVRSYLDGILVASSSLLAQRLQTSTSYSTSDGSSNFSIDDVRVYNRALSTTEITQIYNDFYKRYFYVSDVYRSSSGTITSPGMGSYDPSSKQVTVGYSWVGGSTQTISTYLTRNENFTMDQTDWSGGAAPSGTVLTSPNSQFSTSSNIDYSTTTGSFYLAIPGY